MRTPFLHDIVNAFSWPAMLDRIRAGQRNHGNPVDVWGQSKSPSRTPGHDAAMEAKALQMARSGKYEYVTIQRSWRTATGRVGKSRKIPDVIGVRRDGKVDAIEIRSKTDSHALLEKRLEQGMATVPRARRGQTIVIDP